MKPFEYVAPTSIAEAVALLAARGERARPLAGGTDLLVQMRSGRMDLDLLVDVKRIPELTELSFDPVRGLTVGAAVPCFRISRDARVVANYPALVDATSIIGGAAIQGRATLGGNLCNAAPSADSVPAMIVLHGRCRVVGSHGTRSVPVAQFNTAPGKSCLEPGELLASLQFPPPPPHFGARHLRFIPRFEMDIAVVGCAASVMLSEDGTTIRSARIALATVAPTALLAEEASQACEGAPVSGETIELASRLAQQAARPRTTTRGTAAQRRHLVGVLTRRALWGAINRARGEHEDGR